MYEFETRAYSLGFHFIVGVDEAGRGPLAGPVVAGAVILDPNNIIEGLNDSKQLSESKREFLYGEIVKKSLAYAVAFVDEMTIEQINILEASRLAMTKAIQSLQIKPDYILTDAMKLPSLEIPYEDIIKGDAKSASIAAASIIAKVSRDRYMLELSKIYPNYGFEKHKGYGTKQHLEAIDRYGVLPIHRKGFAPIRKRLSLQQELDLFREDEQNESTRI